MSMSLSAALSVGKILKQRKQTIAVAESSTGGLIAASLLAVPGASAYFLGGTVIYTLEAREHLLGLERAVLRQQEPLTTDYVALCAEQIRQRLNADWGIAELGAAGPAGTPYGHPPGICALAISGPRNLRHVLTTDSSDREQNMQSFTAAALKLLEDALSDAA